MGSAHYFGERGTYIFARFAPIKKGLALILSRMLYITEFCPNYMHTLAFYCGGGGGGGEE